MTPFFTVAVPALNLRVSIELLIRCLEAQSYPHDLFECVIVDDGSTDGTSEFLQKCCPDFNLRYLRNPVPLGRGAARNMAWHHGQGDIIAFLDGDTLPAPDWLADYASAFAQGGYEVISGERYHLQIADRDRLAEELSGMASVAPEDLFRAHSEEQFAALHRHAAPGPYPGRAFREFEEQMPSVCEKFPYSPICGYSFAAANIAVDRRWLAEVRGFDTSLRRGEDTDLGIRLWEAGARFRYVQGARAYHQCLRNEADRYQNASELLSFFYRHPYTLVLSIYLWFSDQSAKEPKVHWPGGVGLSAVVQDAMAPSSLDIEEHLTRIGHPRLPIDARHNQDSLSAYFHDISGVSKTLIATYIEEALRKGLYTRLQDGDRRYDLGLVASWLRYRTPFQENTLRTGSYARGQRALFATPLAQRKEARILCRGAYEVTVADDGLSPYDIQAALNIPLPVENCWQRDLQFVSCWPPDLLSHVDAHSEWIPRYPWLNTGENFRLRYEFVCSVSEAGGFVREEDARHIGPLSEWLRPSLRPTEYPKAKSMLRQILASGRPGPLDLARRIYYWLLNNTSFNEGTSARSLHILDSGFGMCLDHARLFVNLCRLGGIPARERYGATLGLGPTAREAVANSVCFTPFAHAWAECHIQDLGWMPVEFSGWGFGKRSLTSANVLDEELRRECMTMSDDYDRYYFGTLDPYRIYAPLGTIDRHFHLECADQDKGRISPETIKHTLNCILDE